MSQLFFFHNYVEAGKLNNSNANSNALFVDLSLGFCQLIPKVFEIPDSYSDPKKDCYFLSFYTTLFFKFENNKLTFNKFRFSINGHESKFSDSLDFSEFSDNLHFRDFIELNYHNFIKDIKTLTFNPTQKFIPKKDYLTVPIQEKDCLTIFKDGLQYIHRIFPNPKDIIIIDESTADFFQPKDLKDSIYIYEKSTMIHLMNKLENNLSSSNKSHHTKKIKL